MRYVFFIVMLLFCTCKNKRNNAPVIDTALALNKILIVTETQGYRHESIEDGVAMFVNNAKGWGIVADVMPNTEQFANANLKDYKVIVLLNTTGDVFSDTEQNMLQTFVRESGGILAIHAAADAEYDWLWYGQMLGAWFESHPAIQTADCKVVNQAHPATSQLPIIWRRTDEWYNFKALQQDNTLLITVDENTYNGGKHGATHPISWCRVHEGGKIFYTAMGHTKETFADPLFQQHIKGALQWLTK